MSRTYRRNKSNVRRGWFDNLNWYTGEWVRYSDCGYRTYWRPYPRDSKEYKKGKARYHSDAGTHNCKEPGPSWFRNLYNTRPNRRAVQQEIAKWVKDADYEPVIDPKPHLPYWT